MYLCHNLNGDATQQIDARRRRGLVVADRVRTVTFSAGGLSSLDICPRRRRHPSQRHACTMRGVAWQWGVGVCRGENAGHYSRATRSETCWASMQ